MSDTVAACPACDRASLHTCGDAYRCHNCGARVAEPEFRPPKQSGEKTRRGPAGDLVDADPSEVDSL